MPRYVRKQPLIERIKSHLNPWDFLLWLSEELESNGWDQLGKGWALPIAVSLNLLFIIARANISTHSQTHDDVFGESRRMGFFAWLAIFIVHSLTWLSILNATYAFWRSKNYRLFENAVENIPNTPSAHRVRVDSLPATSSPLRFLSSVLGADSARSRAHPDPVKDVWELVVWDPSPISLRLFCYFSPGHVIIYWLFLPTLASDPRPSTTVATAMILALLLSIQLVMLATRFSQQSKDAALISKEVLNEYDTKYVRPRTQPLYRDVGTQFSEQASYSERREEQYNTVDVYSPTVIINRGFKPNPNPNYVPHVDPDATNTSSYPRQSLPASGFRTPGNMSAFASPANSLVAAVRQPVFKPPSGYNDGGSFGIYSHAASPLRQQPANVISPAKNTNASQAARERSLLSPERRPRLSVPAEGMSTAAATQRWGHLKPDRHRRESGRI